MNDDQKWGRDRLVNQAMNHVWWANAAGNVAAHARAIADNGWEAAALRVFQLDGAALNARVNPLLQHIVNEGNELNLQPGGEYMAIAISVFLENYVMNITAVRPASTAQSCDWMYDSALTTLDRVAEVFGKNLAATQLGAAEKVTVMLLAKAKDKAEEVRKNRKKPKVEVDVAAQEQQIIAAMGGNAQMPKLVTITQAELDAYLIKCESGDTPFPYLDYLCAPIIPAGHRWRGVKEDRVGETKTAIRTSAAGELEIKDESVKLLEEDVTTTNARLLASTRRYMMLCVYGGRLALVDIMAYESILLNMALTTGVQLAEEYDKTFRRQIASKYSLAQMQNQATLLEARECWQTQDDKIITAIQQERARETHALAWKTQQSIMSMQKGGQGRRGGGNNDNPPTKGGKGTNQNGGGGTPDEEGAAKRQRTSTTPNKFDGFVDKVGEQVGIYIGNKFFAKDAKEVKAWLEKQSAVKRKNTEEKIAKWQ